MLFCADYESGFVLAPQGIERREDGTALVFVVSVDVVCLATLHVRRGVETTGRGETPKQAVDNAMRKARRVVELLRHESATAAPPTRSWWRR